VSGLSPQDTFTPFAGQSAEYNYPAPGLFDFHFFVFDTVSGHIDLCLGVWPGDPRKRWLWIHRGFYDPFPVLAANYWDQILGDHLVMHQAAFDAGFIQVFARTDAGGLYAPYI